MGKIYVSLLLLGSVLIYGCGRAETQQTVMQTEIPNLTNSPTPSLTVESNLPLDWQLAPLTAAQVSEVQACDVIGLAVERYSEESSNWDIHTLESNHWDLSAFYQPETACDWAVLAYAYTQYVKIPNRAEAALGKAVSSNYGYLFSAPIFDTFMDNSMSIVGPQPVFEQEITEVRIQYKWQGFGQPVSYYLKISQATTDPQVMVTSYQLENLSTEVDRELVQKLGDSLANLLPISRQFTLAPCTDNLPDWTVTIIFEDDTRIVLRTNESNFMTLGGPWQTTVEGQAYLQFSLEFMEAVDSLIQHVGLPYGYPSGMFCEPFSVLDVAYP